MRTRILIFGFLGALFAFAGRALAQGDEIVANLAGGRVIIHVANDAIIFGAIDQPLEAKSVPPRVAEIDLTPPNGRFPQLPNLFAWTTTSPAFTLPILIVIARREPAKPTWSRLALDILKSCDRSSASFTIRSTCSPTSRFSRSL